MPKNLKKAIEDGDLESFIKEHEADNPGDLDKVDKLIRQASAQPETQHASDCAVHNEPAMPAGPCDCGATTGR